MVKHSEEYVNFSIPLASEVRVAQELRRLKRLAYIMPAQAAFVVVCDADAEGGDSSAVDRIAQQYALAFGHELESQIRRLVDRALRDFREDRQAFGKEA